MVNKLLKKSSRERTDYFYKFNNSHNNNYVLWIIAFSLTVSLMIVMFLLFSRNFIK